MYYPLHYADMDSELHMSKYIPSHELHRVSSIETQSKIKLDDFFEECFCEFLYKLGHMPCGR